MEDTKLYEIEEVIQSEDAQLLKRRSKLFSASDAEKLGSTRFGLALSGGGIRSATINMGFLKTLNKFDLLKRADYLSTVSGGGYCGSYIQTTLKDSGDAEKLFDESHVAYMRNRGEYLVPGKGLRKIWSQAVLVITYVTSLVMSLVSPAIPILLVYGLWSIIRLIFQFDESGFEKTLDSIFYWSTLAITALVLCNFFYNIVMKFSLSGAAHFHRLQTVFLGVLAISVFVLFAFHISGLASPDLSRLGFYALIGAVLIFIGFWTSPNATSLHRFYRNQLADAFLNFSGPFKNVALKDLFQAESPNEKDYLAPYPLVNTCLNLQSSDDPRFKGSKTSDYFLLSPLFCGSKLTNYVPTGKKRGYHKMSFPAAITISAAAVNPGMGIYSNKILAILTTLFNARLGYWTWNPLKTTGGIPIIWWPFYYFFELFSKTGTDKKMVNISDGGHIENLAVYELLRRKCRLIMAVDAGEDASYGFSDLENLTVRARNELGVEIKFREGDIPEEVIRPKPSLGYSQRRYALADLLTIWEEFLVRDKDGNLLLKEGASIEALINYTYHEDSDNVDFTVFLKWKGKILQDEDIEEAVRQQIDYRLNIILADKIGSQKLKFGTLVYVKSSVTAPAGKPPIEKDDRLKFGTYKYKIYHPNFPHEPTSDQFFDDIQWEAYYQLGQFIGADVLDIPDFLSYHSGKKEGKPLSIEALIDWFDRGKPLFEEEIKKRALPGEEPGAPAVEPIAEQLQYKM